MLRPGRKGHPIDSSILPRSSDYGVALMCHHSQGSRNRFKEVTR